MQANDFMAVEAHFERLVAQLPAAQQKAYNACKHLRIETAFETRHFITYEMVDGSPVELDRIVVEDFQADHRHGVTTRIASRKTGEAIVVGYTPTQVFEHPIFVWVPLHARLRWGATSGNLHKGSLGFPLAIRTQSRLGLRERGVTYMETGPAFGMEFDKATSN
jgi:hypothetical protein